MVKLLADEHVAGAVVSGLRRRGVDVLTLNEAGLLAAEDGDILARARLEGRVVFTQDQDFLRLHAAGLPHAGIAFAPHGTPVGKLIQGLMLIHQILDAEDMHNHVEFL